MTLTHEVMRAVAHNRGQLHILELGATVGLLAALLWRDHRGVSYAILTLCTGLVVVQMGIAPQTAFESAKFRLAKYPFHFLGPMAVMTMTMVAVDALGRRWIRRDGSAEVNELLDDTEQSGHGQRHR